MATVLNDGPDPVTIAQIQVDDAYWSFTAEPGTTVGHLGRTTLTIPYPWVQGDAHALRLVTSTVSRSTMRSRWLSRPRLRMPGSSASSR